MDLIALRMGGEDPPGREEGEQGAGSGAFELSDLHLALLLSLAAEGHLLERAAGDTAPPAELSGGAAGSQSQSTPLIQINNYYAAGAAVPEPPLADSPPKAAAPKGQFPSTGGCGSSAAGAKAPGPAFSSGASAAKAAGSIFGGVPEAKAKAPAARAAPAEEPPFSKPAPKAVPKTAAKAPPSRPPLLLRPVRRSPIFASTSEEGDEEDGSAYAVWAAAGSLEELRGVHSGPNAWQGIAERLATGGYISGRDRLRRFPSRAAAVRGYSAECVRHQAPYPIPVFVWP